MEQGFEEWVRGLRSPSRPDSKKRIEHKDSDAASFSSEEDLRLDGEGKKAH